MPFQRLYAPILARHGVSEREFIDFIDTLNVVSSPESPRSRRRLHRHGPAPLGPDRSRQHASRRQGRHRARQQEPSRDVPVREQQALLWPAEPVRAARLDGGAADGHPVSEGHKYHHRVVAFTSRSPSRAAAPAAPAVEFPHPPPSQSEGIHKRHGSHKLTSANRAKPPRQVERRPGISRHSEVGKEGPEGKPEEEQEQGQEERRAETGGEVAVGFG